MFQCHSQKTYRGSDRYTFNKIKDNDLNLKNLGSFKIINKKERVGRNPKTKEEFLIKPRKSISFTASKNFKLDINNSD